MSATILLELGQSSDAARQIATTYDPDASDAEQAAAASGAMETAIDELQAVCSTLENLSQQQRSDEGRPEGHAEGDQQ